MSFIYPDLEWYTAISKQEKIPLRCPYANAHRCPRYYASLHMLGKYDVITKIKEDKVKELDELWEKSDVLPVIAEHDTGILKVNDHISSYSNFCPEVSFDIFKLFAVLLISYKDEYDQEASYAQMKVDAYPKDWRVNWMHVEPLHYFKCPVYFQLITRPVEKDTDTLLESPTPEIIEVKPGIFGISLNVRAALSRLAKWWLSKQP